MGIKHMEVDWDNYEDIEKHIDILHKRLIDLGYINVGNKTSKTLKRSMLTRKNLEAIYEIYMSDISSLYSFGYNLDKKYYVYVHCNPLIPLKAKKDIRHIFAASELGLKSEPFYVGKGTGDRCYSSDRSDSYRKIKERINKYKREIEIVKIKEGLSEGEAFGLESKIIDIFGIKSFGGILTNLDEGKSPTERRKIYTIKSRQYLRSSGTIQKHIIR